ncbi:MAG: AAA family ATPase, partial [Halobacteriovoraceae bacterium]|nr:AAA family ATPase [Halobacteriovoraceae bacterium]
TRLSMSFKDVGKASRKRDTLYFNAFTEDLFTWDNDLENNKRRVLKINEDSHFFDGLPGLSMEDKIRQLLDRYVTFKFRIDYEKWEICFDQEIRKDDQNFKEEDIKISRGEENIFIWCFFLAIAQLAIEKEETYKWVKYLYIDDPITSLDDNNAIAVAGQLAQLLKSRDNEVKTIISSHHALFFNVMYNELNKNSKSYFLNKEEEVGRYLLSPTGETPFFYHVALLKELNEVADSGKLYTYHFNILRTILEKTAVFHGFEHFSSCIEQGKDDTEDAIRTRMINILNHGNYSLFDPKEMVEENKKAFKKILKVFRKNYRFNSKLFPNQAIEDN